MNINYGKLLGKMKELGFTQEVLAPRIGISKGTLSAKFNSKTAFTATEIADICRVLDISKLDIGDYFFTEKVQ